MVPPQDRPNDRSFATTRWSLLFVLRSGSPTAAQAALGKLCQIYREPIFRFIRSFGYDAEDTADLTQRFMLHLVEQEAFSRADRTKGKLRSYLLRILKRFLAHARRDERTQKRGGGAEFVPLDEAVTSEIETREARYGHPAALHSLDRQWALLIRRRLDDRIAAEYADANKSELYLTLRRHLTAEKSAGSYKANARRLGRPVVTVRSDVARMRRRYTELLLEELKKAAPPADLKQELLHYCRIIALL